MSVFKKKTELVKVNFQCHSDLAKRLKKVEDSAKAKGLDFDLDEHLSSALSKLVNAAEKELAK